MSSSSQEATRRWAYRLGAAVSACLVHRQSLDGLIPGIRGVDITDRRNGGIPFDGDRTIWMVRQMFDIEVGDILTVGAGPASPSGSPKAPDTTPWTDFPVVGTGQSGSTIQPADPEVF